MIKLVRNNVIQAVADEALEKVIPTPDRHSPLKALPATAASALVDVAIDAVLNKDINVKNILKKSAVKTIANTIYYSGRARTG